MRKFLLLAAVVGFVSTAQAAVIFADDFESYADRAAMFAPGAWGDAGAVPAATATLGTATGNPSQFMFHPGGGSGRHSIPNTMTGNGTIIWEFDFRGDGGTPTNKRVTGGLRVGSGAGTGILEMGFHNNNLNVETGLATAGFAVRTVNIGGVPNGVAGNGWLAFPGNPNPTANLGWHHFRAIINTTSILFELDLGDNGTVDASRLVTTNDTSAATWNVLRLGGPSDVSSGGGSADFDNVSISQVPEPTALALILASALLARRR